MTSRAEEDPTGWNWIRWPASGTPPFAAWVLLFACASFDAPVCSATVPLIISGTPKLHLVLDQDPEGLNRTVVEDLGGILKRISGSDLPTTAGQDTIPLFVGEAEQFDDLPVNAPALDEESFYLKVTPQGIYVLGGSPLGTSHGVYTLLQKLGCRWIMPGRIGECLPKTSHLFLEEGEETGSPDFSFRVVWYAYGCSADASVRYEEWMRRNRMRRPPVQHGHNLTNTLSVLAPFEQRPDLYSLNDGKRTKQQICTSNPETVALVTNAIGQYLDRYPETIAYSLCPDDNTDFCECDNCRALDVGHMDRGGKPSVSDRYQVFLNQVLDGLSKAHPKAWVTHYAYNTNHTDTPRKVPVHPNTCIFLTTSVFCSAHGIGDSFCESRMDFKQLLAEWTAKTRHVYIYEYDPVPYSGGLPWPMWDAHGREAPVYKKMGVEGLSFEGQNSWASYFPNYYVASQMMWDADQDYRLVFDAMLNSFFGEAADEMETYYAALASHLGQVDEKVEWGLTDYPHYFPVAVVEAARKALEGAEAKASDPLVKERLAMVRMSFDQMDAYLAMHRADASTTWAEYKGQIDRLNEAIDRMEQTNEDYLLANIAREKTLAGISQRFGPEQGFVNRWLICGPFENTGWVGHDTELPPEKSFDPKGVYEGKKGLKVSWRLNRTPEWQGFVDFKKEYELSDWVCACALCWVTLEEGPKDVLIRAGSNDSLKILVNDRVVWDNKTQRTASVDEDVIPLTLPQGTSRILVKVGQTGLNWGFYFRITEPDSLEVPPGLSYSTDEPGR